MSMRLKELALRKEVLALKAEAHRLEIERELHRLGSAAHGLTSGISVVRRLAARPVLASAAGALVSRIGIGRLLKIAAVAGIGWFGYQVARAAQSRED
jgi:hypothetical protein